MNPTFPMMLTVYAAVLFVVGLWFVRRERRAASHGVADTEQLQLALRDREEAEARERLRREMLAQMGVREERRDPTGANERRKDTPEKAGVGS